MLELNRRDVEEVWRLMNDAVLWGQVHGRAAADGDIDLKQVSSKVILECRDKLTALGIAPPK